MRTGDGGGGGGEGGSERLGVGVGVGGGGGRAASRGWEWRVRLWRWKWGVASGARSIKLDPGWFECVSVGRGWRSRPPAHTLRHRRTSCWRGARARTGSCRGTRRSRKPRLQRDRMRAPRLLASPSSRRSQRAMTVTQRRPLSGGLAYAQLCAWEGRRRRRRSGLSCQLRANTADVHALCHRTWFLHCSSDALNE